MFMARGRAAPFHESIPTRRGRKVPSTSGVEWSVVAAGDEGRGAWRGMSRQTSPAWS
jgi:hypothetical protein